MLPHLYAHGMRLVRACQSDDCSHYAADQGERWGHMATKLRLWELTEYKKVRITATSPLKPIAP